MMFSAEEAPNSSNLLTVLLICLFLYSLGKVAYLLYLHPLAIVPGPTLAAVSSLWYCYHELLGKGSVYLQIERLHQKHGMRSLVYRDKRHI